MIETERCISGREGVEEGININISFLKYNLKEKHI